MFIYLFLVKKEASSVEAPSRLKDPVCVIILVLKLKNYYAQWSIKIILMFITAYFKRLHKSKSGGRESSLCLGMLSVFVI